MKYNLANPRAVKVARSAFTLIELLTAMLFMAIVIPVALQAMQVATRAGEVAERKMIAARIGNNKLNELKVTGQLQNAAQRGAVQEGGLNFNWAVKNETWTEDPLSQMILATVTVTFNVQGKPYDVRLSTIFWPQNQGL